MYSSMFRLVMNKEPNEEAANEAMELLLKNLDVYEVILGATKYLAGDVSPVHFNLSSIIPH
jgi:glutathione S-transferase